jgi:hypothetical protein
MDGRSTKRYTRRLSRDILIMFFKSHGLLTIALAFSTPAVPALHANPTHAFPFNPLLTRLRFNNSPDLKKGKFSHERDHKGRNTKGGKNIPSHPAVYVGVCTVLLCVVTLCRILDR